MKLVVLFLLVGSIFLYECYWPIPDYTKDEFNEYYPLVVQLMSTKEFKIIQKKLIKRQKEIYTEHLILHKITSPLKLSEYLKVRDGIVYNKGEQKKLKQIQEFINEYEYKNEEHKD